MEHNDPPDTTETRQMSPVEPEPTSLRIQVVLFDTPITQISLLLESLLASMWVARGEGSLSHAEIAFGDCSSLPCLTDEETERIRANALDNGFDAATYDFFDENLGSAGGSNRLAQGAETDMILVLNPDTYASPQMLNRQLRAFRDDIGVVEARQLPIEHPKDHDPVTHEVSWVSGACAMFRRSVFEEVGGFDTDNFFLHCDDVDISWRIRAGGYRAVIEPAATVLHHKPIDLSGTVSAPNVERYHGLLGKLMLATRFDRPQIVEKTIEWVRDNGDSVQNDAVDEYESRVEEDRIPDVLSAANNVAQFIGTEFARHRF